MAQTTFEKTMRNVNLSDNPRERTPRYLRKSWQFEVDIDPTEHQKLRAFMKCELEYYNALVGGLSSRMRTTPETITDANEENERLYLTCAETAFDPYKFFLMRKVDFAEGEEPELPEKLEPFRNLFFSVDSKGNRRFTDRIALLCQMFAEKSPIHSIVRRAIAYEMIQFYRLQVKATQAAVPMHLQAEQIYKTAPQNLEVHDIIRKRHLQIPKSAARIKWNVEEERTEIRIPYTHQTLLIPNMNFVDEIKSWNHLILHQAPGGIPMATTPWILDVRSIQGSYLLKYTDVRTPHAGAAFHQAKRGVGARH